MAASIGCGAGGHKPDGLGRSVHLAGDLEIRRVPNAPAMSFQVQVVAVPDDGGEAVPFPALEALGQG